MALGIVLSIKFVINHLRLIEVYVLNIGANVLD